MGSCSKRSRWPGGATARATVLGSRARKHLEGSRRGVRDGVVTVGRRGNRGRWSSNSAGLERPVRKAQGSRCSSWGQQRQQEQSQQLAVGCAQSQRTRPATWLPLLLLFFVQFP